MKVIGVTIRKNLIIERQKYYVLVYDDVAQSPPSND